MPGLLPSNTNLSHYRIISPLGAGGMGEIYLAEDTRLGRKVALKLLPTQFTKDEDRVRRFEQEARAASALNHPNIITIYDIGRASVEDGGIHFIATEFIEGQTLRQQLLGARMQLGEALEVALQVAGALEAAHAAGITHRDIKPENIMVRPDGYVKVLDFGLAKLTERQAVTTAPEAPTLLKAQTDPGTVMGTAFYMSPEQARGLEVDARSDLFSLGIVLYEMIAGRMPFEGQTASDVMAAILRVEPLPLSHHAPQIPAEIESSVARALRKDCAERYQAAKDLLRDLKRLKQRLEFEAELQRASGNDATTIFTLPLTSSLASPDPYATTRHRASGVRRPRLRRVIDSLAVLPLINESQDPNTEYLADGITESIINSLSQLPKLRVVPRSTVFRYKGREVDPQETGQELGVRALLSGRIKQVGEILVIKIELMDIARESQLWGHQYRRKMTNIFAVEEEISREISDHLRLKLSGEEKKRLVKRYTDNTEAYHLYLKGRYYTASKRTEEWIKKGVEHFQQAIDLDPNYALAYAGLGDAYAFLASSTGGWAPREAYPIAKAAALKALEIDDALGEAHCSLGFFRLLYDWDFAAAELEFKRAIKLSPGYANSHDGYAFYLKAMGRHEEAIRVCQKVQQLDPLSPFTYVGLGWAYYFARQYDLAIEQCHKALEIDPRSSFAYRNIGMAELQRGNIADAIAALSKAFTLSSSLPYEAHLGYAYALAGKRTEAQEVIAELEELAPQRYVSAYYFAIVYLGLGELDQAFTWLERAYEERSGFLPFLKVEPLLDGLRGDARFDDLLRRVALAE